MSTMIAGATQTAQGVIPIDVVESPLPTSTPELPRAAQRGQRLVVSDEHSVDPVTGPVTATW
jgi:hypothetical protein